MTTTPQAALLSAQNPLLKRCYTMSESHLSGYRVVIGFERLEDAQDAHEYIAKLQATQEPVQDGDCQPICTLPFDCLDAENEANARLIAAAPDLLDALDTLCNRIELESATPLDWPAYTQARSAIAKATGAQHG